MRARQYDCAGRSRSSVARRDARSAADEGASIQRRARSPAIEDGSCDRPLPPPPALRSVASPKRDACELRILPCQIKIADPSGGHHQCRAAAELAYAIGPPSGTVQKRTWRLGVSTIGRTPASHWGGARTAARADGDDHAPRLGRKRLATHAFSAANPGPKSSSRLTRSRMSLINRNVCGHWRLRVRAAPPTGSGARPLPRSVGSARCPGPTPAGSG